MYVNGKLTLGENTADNGGVRVALMALLNTIGNETGKIDGFTPEQRFFLSFGQVWCENAREEALRLQVQTNPHSPAEFRVNGVVENMPEFQPRLSPAIPASRWSPSTPATCGESNAPAPGPGPRDFGLPACLCARLGSETEPPPKGADPAVEDLISREIPRLCRGGSGSLTFPAPCLPSPRRRHSTIATVRAAHVVLGGCDQALLRGQQPKSLPALPQDRYCVLSR